MYIFKDKENTREKGRQSIITKKNYPLGTYKVTRPVDRKQNYFQGWPHIHVPGM